VDNPYQSPSSQVQVTETSDPEGVEAVRKGQKLIIYAILTNIGSTFLSFVHPVFGVIGIVALGLTVYGLYTLGKGMKAAIWLKVLIVISMFVPLINLLVLLRINGNATNRLRTAGYKVGLLGAYS
jgi:hypothetical protein